MPTGVIDWIHLLNAEEDSDYHPLEKKRKGKTKKQQQQQLIHSPSHAWRRSVLRSGLVLGDILHSVMLPFLYLFLFLWNILT